MSRPSKWHLYQFSSGAISGGCPAHLKALAISAAAVFTAKGVIQSSITPYSRRDHSICQASASSILKIPSNQPPRLVDNSLRQHWLVVFLCPSHRTALDWIVNKHVGGYCLRVCELIWRRTKNHKVMRNNAAKGSSITVCSKMGY